MHGKLEALHPPQPENPVHVSTVLINCMLRQACPLPCNGTLHQHRGEIPAGVGQICLVLRTVSDKISRSQSSWFRDEKDYERNRTTECHC